MSKKPLAILLLSLFFSTLCQGCAVDPRTSAALADALVDGPIRTYAAAQSDTAAQTCMLLQKQAAPSGGAMPELAAAQTSWRKARAAYDRGVALFLIAAPEYSFELDGPPDDVFAIGGLRQVERALFAQPTAPAAELTALTLALRDSAIKLHLAASSRPVNAAGLVGSMSALASLLATKLDGSATPYAGAADAVASAQNSLVGLQAMYAILSPVVQGADPLLDERLTTALHELLEQLRALPSLDLLADKPRYLRQCAALSIAIADLGRALGFPVTVIDVS